MAAFNPTISRERQTIKVKWAGARSRCHKESNPEYRNYGRRGITMCARWRASSDAFVSDMGPRPSQKHTLERTDNNKGYWCGRSECPECGPLGRTPNCRWATQKEQRRNSSQNRYVEANGERLTIVEWAERLGIPGNTITDRIDKFGWSEVEAVTTPARVMRKSSLQPKSCERCGSPFTSQSTAENSQRRFCTQKCRLAAKRQRLKAKAG